MLKNELIFPTSFFAKEKIPAKGIVKLSYNNLTFESKEDNFVYPASLEFQETVKLFCLNSCFTKRWVLQIMQKVSILNAEIEAKEIFPTVFNEAMTLDSFWSYFDASIGKFINHSKSIWIKSVATEVEKCL